MSVIVFISWCIGYYSNALYGMKFEINSCWTGISALATSGIGVLKWIIDSINNSQKEDLPAGYKK
jgi:hypothetical protein